MVDVVVCQTFHGEPHPQTKSEDEFFQCDRAGDLIMGIDQFQQERFLCL